MEMLKINECKFPYEGEEGLALRSSWSRMGVGENAMESHAPRGSL